MHTAYIVKGVHSLGFGCGCGSVAPDGWLFRVALRGGGHMFPTSDSLTHSSIFALSGVGRIWGGVGGVSPLVVLMAGYLTDWYLSL